MPELVLFNVKQYVAGLDFSGSYNMHSLVIEAEAKEKTAFGDNPREYLGGLKLAGSEHDGFWDSPVDADLFAAIGAAARNVTVSPGDGLDGDVAFFFEELATEYSPGEQVGEVFAFSNSNQPTGVVARGLIMATGAKTTSANGVARGLGAVSSTQRIRASLHVLAVSGTAPTLDVVVESDDASGMASPITRITFPRRTAIGGEILTAAGPITDTWWRARWTIGGTAPSFTFVVAIGVA